MIIARLKLMNTAGSEDITKSLYGFIPKGRRRDFMAFARSFGPSGEMTVKRVGKL